MKRKNPYRKNSHLLSSISREIIKYFSLDFDAYKTSEILKWKVSYRTIKDWYNYIREAIYFYSKIKEKEVLWWWTYELDESYFWAKRIRWKRWRWAWWKIKVFWILKRNNQVYTQIVSECTAKELLPIIRWKIDNKDDIIINSDWWKSYDWLVDLWYKKHYRVHHWDNEFARWKQHINWIESFWSFTKRRLVKFNWIKKEKFIYHLKESEFRFNCKLSQKDINKELLKLLKKYTKKSY